MHNTRMAVLLLAIISNSAAADEFALLKEEQIGPLRVDQPAAEAERLITCPVQRGPVELWGADGEYHQAWTAPACGLTLDLSAGEPTGAQTVRAITLTRPSAWKTARCPASSAGGRCSGPGYSQNTKPWLNSVHSKPTAMLLATRLAAIESNPRVCSSALPRFFEADR